MPEIRSFRDLEVWQLSMEVAEECYALTAHLPAEERYGLTSQIRRCAVSVPANIAEGHRRRGKVFRHHIDVALGSHAELDTELELATRLQLIPAAASNPVRHKVARVGQMLHGLRRSLREHTGRDAPRDV